MALGRLAWNIRDLPRGMSDRVATIDNSCIVLSDPMFCQRRGYNSSASYMGLALKRA